MPETRNKIVDDGGARAWGDAMPGIPRPAEAVVAFVGLLAISPLLAVAAVAIKLTSNGPIVFRQIRIGRGGKPFVLYKLRTMRESRRGPQITATNDHRVTRIGRLLRRTKIDELPELWNIIKGDMSFVGPRPEVPRYVAMDSEIWRTVLTVRPGLTDPVTLRLRNEEALLSKIEGDREEFYTEMLLPYKLDGYIGYLNIRTWKSDVIVLCRTAVATLLPGTVPPPTPGEISRAK